MVETIEGHEKNKDLLPLTDDQINEKRTRISQYSSYRLYEELKRMFHLIEGTHSIPIPNNSKKGSRNPVRVWGKVFSAEFDPRQLFSLHGSITPEQACHLAYNATHPSTVRLACPTYDMVYGQRDDHSVNQSDIQSFVENLGLDMSQLDNTILWKRKIVAKSNIWYDFVGLQLLRNRIITTDGTPIRSISEFIQYQKAVVDTTLGVGENLLTRSVRRCMSYDFLRDLLTNGAISKDEIPALLQRGLEIFEEDNMEQLEKWKHTNKVEVSFPYFPLWMFDNSESEIIDPAYFPPATYIAGVTQHLIGTILTIASNDQVPERKELNIDKIRHVLADYYTYGLVLLEHFAGLENKDHDVELLNTDFKTYTIQIVDAIRKTKDFDTQSSDAISTLRDNLLAHIDNGPTLRLRTQTAIAAIDDERIKQRLQSLFLYLDRYYLHQVVMIDSILRHNHERFNKKSGQRTQERSDGESSFPSLKDLKDTLFSHGTNPTSSIGLQVKKRMGEEGSYTG